MYYLYDDRRPNISKAEYARVKRIVKLIASKCLEFHDIEPHLVPGDCLPLNPEVGQPPVTWSEAPRHSQAVAGHPEC